MTSPLDPPPPPSEHLPGDQRHRIWALWLPALLGAVALVLFVLFLVMLDE